jgi:hypothetical protein
VTLIFELTNGWHVATDDLGALDDFCNGELVIRVEGRSGKAYHLNRDRIVCVQEVVE